METFTRCHANSASRIRWCQNKLLLLLLISQFGPVYLFCSVKVIGIKPNVTYQRINGSDLNWLKLCFQLLLRWGVCASRVPISTPFGCHDD